MPTRRVAIARWRRRRQRCDLETERASRSSCFITDHVLPLYSISLTAPALLFFSPLEVPASTQPAAMSSAPVPPSPGFSTRRKAPPKLPLSAFSPPPSGSSTGFPAQPDPSTVHPTKVIDAHVVAPGGDFSKWSAEAGEALGSKAAGVVVSLSGTAPSEVEKAIELYVVTIASIGEDGLTRCQAAIAHRRAASPRNPRAILTRRRRAVRAPRIP